MDRITCENQQKFPKVTEEIEKYILKMYLYSTTMNVITENILAAIE